MPIDSDMVKRAVRAFDAAVDSHRGLGTGDFTAMRAALEASGLPDQNARLVEELSEAKKEITDTQDRLAQIERQVRKLVDEYDESAQNRCGCCDPEIVNTMDYGCACQNAGDAVSEGRDQQSREVACRLRAIIDAPDVGGE